MNSSITMSKYQGLGNDYLILDARRNQFQLRGKKAALMCRRGFGLGADGVLYGPVQINGKMGVHIFNADGSESAISGNGVRIFAKYLIDQGYVSEKKFEIETLAGTIEVEALNARATDFRVKMGTASFWSDEIPVLGKRREVVNEMMTFNGQKYKATCLTVGNPHCILFFDKVREETVKALGPYVENAEIFPHRMNLQICQKIDVGKDALISEFKDDDYLDKNTGGVKNDFGFVAEIDSSPAADDFHFTVQNGNNLTMKAPELETDDPNYNAVKSYISDKYNTMYNHLKQADANNYIDLTSLAKVYLINELGKNWDSGASSFYLTYKKDENGVYKFFASPVWDYDNSLGNARGVENDLRRMGITDYTLPTGWFSTKKNGYNGPNFLAEAVKNSVLMEEVRRTWFEDFLPALAILNKTGVSTGEIYSADVYAKILRDSAGMNYKIWELVTNSGWIADHSSLQRFAASYTYNQFGQVTDVTLLRCNTVKEYDQYTFDGQFSYMMDWLNSRAAWMSAQYISDYQPREPAYVPGDVDGDGEVEIIDVTLILRYNAMMISFTDLQKVAGDVDGDGDCGVVDAILIQRYLAGIISHF